jgi:hypothetical protein
LIVAVIASSPQRGVPVLVPVDAVDTVAILVDIVALEMTIAGVDELDRVVEARSWRDDMRGRRSIERE